MKIIILPFVFLLLLSCEDDKIINKTNSSNLHSMYENNENVIIIENATYLFSSGEKNGTQNDIVLKVIQNEEIDKNTNVSNSHFSISPVDNKWIINDVANEIEIKNNTLVTKKDGINQFEDTYSIYNLEKGNLLLNYTYGELTARIPNTNFKRYIGYTSLANSKNLLKSFDEDVIGVITYASETDLLQKILIKSKENIDSITPDLQLVTLSEESKIFENNVLYFMNLDNNYKIEDINFAFGISYYVGDKAEESAFLFEIKNDNIVEESIKFDNSIFEIEFLN